MRELGRAGADRGRLVDPVVELAHVGRPIGRVILVAIAGAALVAAGLVVVVVELGRVAGGPAPGRRSPRRSSGRCWWVLRPRPGRPAWSSPAAAPSAGRMGSRGDPG